MSGIMEQSKAEAGLASKHNNDNNFNAKEAHNKDSIVSVTTNGTKNSLSDSSKFALRSATVKDESSKKLLDSFVDSANKSKTKNMKDWTVNKLRFNSVGLLGRDNELKSLHACWERMMQPEQQTKE
eukprot:7381216-Ditylum_brightwellii.AAC.1